MLKCNKMQKIVMNLFLIPAYQQNGAAIASVISEAIVTIMTFTFSLKYVKYNINRKFILISGFACIIMALIVELVKKAISSDVISLVVAVGCGCFIYIILNIILKNPIISELIRLLKKEERNSY